MRWIGTSALLLLLAVDAAVADERIPLTSYESGPMSEADLIVLGTTRSVETRGAYQLATVAVERVLRGALPTRVLTVHIVGPHPTTPLDAPLSYFPTVTRGRHVYFLRAGEGAITAEFRDAFEAQGPVGDEKIAALEREIALAGIEDEANRRTQTRTYLLEGLSGPTAWTRVHATRELRRFAAACPSYIRDQDEALLRRMLETRLPRDQRAHLQRLVSWLENGRSRDARAAPSDPAPVRDPWKAAFLESDPSQRLDLVRGLFEDDGSSRALGLAWWSYSEGNEATRAAIVRFAADQRTRAFRERIRDAYSGEPDADVRREMVRAIGRFGEPEDVAWLHERSANPLLMRTAWLALARIGTSEALAILERAQGAMSASEDPGERRTAEWLAYLRSEAFRTADREG